MNKKLIRKYANVIANKGIGLRKGQQVVVNAPVSAYDFVEILVEELYKCNASRVNVEWSSSNILKTKMKYESEETLKELPKYVKEKAGNQGSTCIIRKLDGSIEKTMKFNSK